MKRYNLCVDNYKNWLLNQKYYQSDKEQTFTEFKAALRSFEDTELTRSVTSDDSVMKTTHKSPQVNNGASSVARGASRDNIVCYRCKQVGHIARFCESKPRLWCSFCRKASHWQYVL